MSVSETCACGAVFEYTSRSWATFALEEREAVVEFREAHRVCREAHAKKAAQEGEDAQAHGRAEASTS